MKRIKLLLSVILIVSTINIFINETSAASNITIYIDNVKQSYSSKATVKSGTTLVPLRGIFESLGAEVKWDQATKTIDASKNGTKVWLKLGSKATKVNGKTVNIAVSAQAVNGTTLVPLRFISEALGAKVEWNQNSKTIKIYQNTNTTLPNPVNPTPEPTKPVGDAGSGTYVIPGAPKSFQNCTEMRKYYPNGVKSSHPAYASKHDRDNDGWACEQ